MPLLNVVKLYRSGGLPQIDNNRFGGELTLNDSNIPLIEDVYSSSGYGRIQEASLNGGDFERGDELLTDGRFQFTYRLSSNSSEKFYQNVNDFLSNCSVVKEGRLPERFYLIDENLYYPLEHSNNSPTILGLERLCELIKCMLKLAHYHDAKSLDGDHKLVFLSNDDGSASPIVLEIDANERMLKADLEDLSILTSLLDDEEKLSAHYNEKRNVFSSTLHEFVKDTDTPSHAFSKFVNSWSTFVKLYNNNLATYLSGFAFHKAKKEVVEAEVKLAEQLANVTSDITGKLFSIPLSLAAIVTIVAKEGSFWGDVILVSSLILVAVIVVGIVDTQRSKLNVVNQSKDLLKKSFEGKQKKFPEDLNTAIADMNKSLDASSTRAARWLTAFYYLSLAPLFIGIFALFAKHCLSAFS